MKKGILCILLAILMVTPLLTACGDKTVPATGIVAPIYTIYTIADKSTTNEAITKVELALNRILYYRLGALVKLEMVTEEEYDELIEERFNTMEEYQASKSNKKGTLSSEQSTQLTGDQILAMLEKGEEIPIDKPSFDIFLVRGYDEYKTLAENKMLADITEKLQNEAKALKSQIHTTLMNSAKVGGRIYGVPVNTAIGEYSYFAFDQELLDKYKIDLNTIKTLEDLNEYLAVIKANEPDVVPLKNAVESADINFLMGNGSPALVTDKGAVIDAYANENLQQYFSLIAQYQSLGYLGSKDDAENTRYAVRIENGYTSDIDKRLESTGYKYTYSLYSNPIATNENTLKNIFCVSKYVVSNDLTKVMEVLTTINTDENIVDLLTYGVENVHYVLNDENQVERISDEYMINPEYISNKFISTTLAGEDPKKWDAYIQQNINAIPSPSLGFTVKRTELTYKDATGKPLSILEPDYVTIVSGIVDKYYPNLMNGTAFEFDYQALVTEATDEIYANITNTLNEYYDTNILLPQLETTVRDKVIAEQSDALLIEATEYTRTNYAKDVKSKLKSQLKKDFKKNNPDMTDEEIQELVDETLTDAYVEENIGRYYTEEDIQKSIQKRHEALLNKAITEAAKKVKELPEYKIMYEEMINSEEYQKELQRRKEYDAPIAIQAKVDEKLYALVTTYTDAMIAEINTEIENAVNTFIEENKGTLGMEKDDILLKIGFLESKEIEGETVEGEDTPKTELVQKYDSWYLFVLKEKITASYYAIYGDPAAKK